MGSASGQPGARGAQAVWQPGACGPSLRADDGRGDASLPCWVAAGWVTRRWCRSSPTRGCGRARRSGCRWGACANQRRSWSSGRRERRRAEGDQDGGTRGPFGCSAPVREDLAEWRRVFVPSGDSALIFPALHGRPWRSEHVAELAPARLHARRCGGRASVARAAVRPAPQRRLPVATRGPHDRRGRHVDGPQRPDGAVDVPARDERPGR